MRNGTHEPLIKNLWLQKARNPHFGLQQEEKSHVRGYIDCLHRRNGEIRVKEKSTLAFYFIFLNPQKNNQHEANTGVWVSL